MPALPEGFVQLAQRYRVDLPAGMALYEQGATLTHFYFVVSGRIAFEALDAAGTRSVVSEAQAGSTVGLVSAFTATPSSASASASEPTTLLAVPVASATDAFRISPALAVTMIREFAAQTVDRRRGAGGRAPVDLPPEPAAPFAIAEELPRGASERIGIEDGFDQHSFFKDELVCPVCETPFELLRVRASAVRPESRDTDFRISYKTVDPSVYAVSVCPHCGFASYFEDFREVSETERPMLLSARDERTAIGVRNVCGERTLDDAVLSVELALACCRARGGGERRRAGLLHRRVWLERSRGDAEAERRYLRETRESYRRVYEHDGALDEAMAMRVAYLIGDLSVRLGERQEARRWLLECVRTDGAANQQRLLRMARDRIEDIRDEEPLARSA